METESEIKVVRPKKAVALDAEWKNREILDT